MNKRLCTLIALLVTCASLPAWADPALATSKNCMACHATDKKLVGPAYKDVAAKYASDGEAVAKLSVKIIKGGVGNWGQIPMPANPQVTQADAETLAKWIMSTK